MLLLERKRMKEIQHAQYGQCYELTEPQDIAFANIAQGARVNNTTLPSGTKTPEENLLIRGKYLVSAAEKPPRTTRGRRS
jgi:hypothetical protein